MSACRSGNGARAHGHGKFSGDQNQLVSDLMATDSNRNLPRNLRVKKHPESFYGLAQGRFVTTK
jgi:hypothetical protein